MDHIIISTPSGKEIARIPLQVIKEMTIQQYCERLSNEREGFKPFRMQFESNKGETLVIELFIVKNDL